MSEKEKQTIEIIKQEIDRLETPKDVYITDIKMLLIIIKRQEKEIEDLKKENNEIWGHLPRLD